MRIISWFLLCMFMLNCCKQNKSSTSSDDAGLYYPEDWDGESDWPDSTLTIEELAT